MNLIRKHKISLITGIPLTGRDKEIIDFIQDKLSGLIPRKYEEYPDSIYFMKNNKILLEQDSKNDSLYCRCEGFWDVLANEYDMEYIDVQTIIKYMVELAFKTKVGTPIYGFRTTVLEVELAFKTGEQIQ